MNNKNTITITISGRSLSGKSTLACALHDFLKLREFNVAIVDDSDIEHRATDFNDKCMEELAQKTSVRIITMQVR